MIYSLYISIILIIVSALVYPKFKVGKFNVSTPLAVGIICAIVLLILDLTLPNLYINPVAFSFFGIDVYWYALWIMLGVVVAVIHGVKEGKKLGIYSDFVYTGILIVLPLSIIGARLWYVLFNLEDFHSIGDVIGLNGGWSGLAIQGGIIVAVISVILYCRFTKVSLFKTFDIVAPGFLIGQIFGRWGNFCNHELYGPLIKNEGVFEALLPKFITDNMYIKGSDLLPGLSAGYYQPMFLYESFLNLIGLIAMFILRRKTKHVESGDMLGLYLIWYGVVRTITESFRFSGEVLMIGNIRVSILVSIIFIVLGILYLVIKRLVFDRVKYIDIIKTVEENKIDTILFDLDGTLIDSKRLIFQSFIHVFEKYYPEHNLTDEELDSFFGPTLYQTFSRYEKDEAKIEEMIKYYREYNEQMHDELVRPFDGVKEVIKYLHKHNYKLGVVSSKKTSLVNHGLELVEIKEYFDIVIGSDDVKNPKPDPEGILKAVKVLNGKNVLYVGDSPSDIKAGQNAHVKTCATIYKTDMTRQDVLLASEPDFIINTFYQLIKKLGD